MYKICVAFGTRPEASKMAPVINALKKHKMFIPFILVTGQHREQLDGMLTLFDIIPDADLKVMTDKQTLPDLMSKIVPQAAKILSEANPDYVLVHGDTLTTFAVTLASFFEQIPVAHVEAGLRSFNFLEPFPEEANRRLTDVLTSLDLPPTMLAKKNLLKEGKKESEIVVTGNTAVDAVNFVVKDALLPPKYRNISKLIAITMHRRENLPVMGELASAIAKLAQKHQDYTFVYPVHLNPIVRNAVWKPLESLTNVRLEEPWEYKNMVALLNQSELVITDSGGIQEESASLGVPTVVLRNVTERPEGVHAGVIKLAGNQADHVLTVTDELLSHQELLEEMRNRPNPYGDGKAGRRVVDAIAWKLGLEDKPRDWEV